MIHGKWQVGDLVRRYTMGNYEHIGNYETMFSLAAGADVGIIYSASYGNRSEIQVYWQNTKETSYYSLYAAEDRLRLIVKRQ